MTKITKRSARSTQKSSRLPTVTVAIPAYNEEVNIESVIEASLKQNCINFRLQHLIVYSDHSTDQTENIVRKLAKNEPIILLKRTQHQIGKTQMLNHIFADCQTDYLIVIDADMAFGSVDVFESLIKQFARNPRAQMVSAHQVPVSAATFIGKIIRADFVLWDYVRLSLPNLNSVHNFYGGGTAYRASFIRSLKIPQSVYEDERGYLFVKAMEQGGFIFMHDAIMLYHAPATTKDYIRMNERSFGKNLDTLRQLFGSAIDGVYDIPAQIKFLGIIRSFWHDPIFTVLAIGYNIIMHKLISHKKLKLRPTWDILKSTKIAFGKATTRPTLIFSNYDSITNPYYGGGAAISIHQLAKLLSVDYDVQIIVGRHRGSISKRIDGVMYQYVGLALGHQLDQLFFQLVLPYYALTRHYTLWFDNFTPPVNLGLLPFINPRKVVGLAHMLPGYESTRRYHLPLSWLEQLSLNRYKQIIATTPLYAKLIKNVAPLPSIHIISNGIDLPTKSRKSAGKYFLYLGRIDIEQKGIDILLKAYASIQKKASLPLYLAGPGRPAEITKLQRLIVSSGLQKRLRYLGQVRAGNKELLISEAAAMILPSRSETFSLVALEALANRIPLICSNVDGLSWIPRNAAIKLSSPTTKTLGNAMFQILSHNQTIQKRIHSGYQLAKQYTWDNVLSSYQKIIKDALSP